MAFLKGLKVDRIKETLETGVKTARENVPNIGVNEVVQGAMGLAATGASAIGKSINGAVRKKPSEEEASSYREFISLLWCLAHVDGSISEDERKTLGELSASIDPDYESYAREVEEECGTKLAEAGKEFGHENAAKIEAQRIIESLSPTSEEAKLLCWNLFALANSDGLDESEVDFIRFASEKAGVEAAVIEELKNYSDAIIEIEESIEQLKRSDRSYGEIEPLVSEFVKRQNVLVEAAQALIADR